MTKKKYQILAFLGWIRHFAASEYWRMRATRAEARLEAERWRNYFREDSLINVPMRSAGMWPMPPRVGPAERPAERAASPSDPVSAFHQLSAMDKSEFYKEVLPDALEHDIPIQQAQAEFVQRVNRRNTLNDEPLEM